MNDPVTMHTGALGSVIHVLRADAETVAELAAVDWNRHFRRVCLDPVRACGRRRCRESCCAAGG